MNKNSKTKNKLYNLVDIIFREGNLGNALEAGRMFLFAAASVPVGEYLGLVLRGTKDYAYSGCCFSSKGTELHSEDYAWIFKGCVSVSSDAHEADGQDCANGLMKKGKDGVSGWKANGKKDTNTGESTAAEKAEKKQYLYGIISVLGTVKDVDIPNRGNHDYIDPFEDSLNEVQPEYISEMLKTLADLGGEMSLRAGNTERNTGHGSIIISLPDKMNFKLRSLITKALPHMSAVELNDGEEPECIPDRLFGDIFSGILFTLMKSNKFLVNQVVKDIDDLPDDLLDEEDEFEYDDPYPNEVSPSDGLERLDLSVRAYNCLLRSGINKISDLLEKSEEDLMKCRNMGRKNMKEIKEALGVYGFHLKEESPGNKDYRTELDELIGLDEVKRQVKKIAAFARMKKELEESGQKRPNMALNMEFTGNPGTAKTTVARILANLFYKLGLLESGEIVEVGRSSLVAAYVGQTAIAVKDVFKKAKGKLLFIDEAYSLVDSHENSFGDEAITTIVQEMENNRDETVVIFAGYPKEMKEFFEKNPGLRSRVPFSISFKDYSDDELVQIAEMIAEQNGFSLSPEAKTRVKEICKKAGESADMGNGRFSRNLVESAILGYAERVYGQDAEDSSDETEKTTVKTESGTAGITPKSFVLEAEDFTVPEEYREEKRARVIGFKA